MAQPTAPATPAEYEVKIIIGGEWSLVATFKTEIEARYFAQERPYARRSARVFLNGKII